ncbi:hypothetical protein H8F21_22090 [Pseudomonas sp. P66]|uniref:Uncharacterized protein n=1 Tax=Pseudomonas arcuscaelestis TaxID=2710591 RepID=A0ABS2C2Z5_9PSED|nr:hypothetical protein [Pseudomonas arcuscaelestis]MBM5460258.1 hypothetical protein [Pseudomonas arcuscaelestis]
MTSKCRAVIAPTIPGLIKALHRQGFFLVTDLPQRISIEVRRNMLVVKLP